MRIVLADDEILIREGLAAMLSMRGVEVLHAAADAHDLLVAVAEHAPDAVIVDIRMPPTFTTEGIVAAGRIKAEYAHIGVLVLSMHVDWDYALMLINTGQGGVGYLLKERVLDVDQVITALQQVISGGSVIDPTIVEDLMSRRRTGGRLDRLTAREQEVLALMAAGYTNRAIAGRLHLSPKTVEAYVTSILTRLEISTADDVHRRVAAVLMYLHTEGAATTVEDDVTDVPSPPRARRPARRRSP